MDILRRYCSVLCASSPSHFFWVGSLVTLVAMVISNIHYIIGMSNANANARSGLKNKDMCVVLKGALTNVKKTAERNRERLQFLERRGRWFYVGGDVELKKLDKEKLKPMGYDWVLPAMEYVKRKVNVEEVLRRVYGRWKIKFEKVVVISERKYQQLWNETHSARYESCLERIKGEKWASRGVAEICSRSSLTFETIAKMMKYETCNFVVVYRPDLVIDEEISIEEILPPPWLKVDEMDAWENRTHWFAEGEIHNGTSSRTDLIVTRRENFVERLEDFTETIWWV